MKIIWSEKALTSLQNARFYLEVRNPKASKKLIEIINEKLDLLKTQPLMGVKDISKNVRKVHLVTHPYTIYYFYCGDEIIKILRIRHTSTKEIEYLH
jgi:addiction module RelE/StbE family toxin